MSGAGEINGSRLLYFTQAELEIMLELSDGPPFSVCRTGKPPDAPALTEALHTLFQRGFLLRDGDGFHVSPGAAFFGAMRRAPTAVVLTAWKPIGQTAVCYGGDGVIWLAETLRTALGETIRLRRLGCGEMADWLCDAGILDTPRLSREDVRELSALMEDIPTDGPVRLRLERNANGGGQTGLYEFVDTSVTPMVRSVAEGPEHWELYTKEALLSVLEACFGKETV